MLELHGRQGELLVEGKTKHAFEHEESHQQRCNEHELRSLDSRRISSAEQSLKDIEKTVVPAEDERAGTHTRL